MGLGANLLIRGSGRTTRRTQRPSHRLETRPADTIPKECRGRLTRRSTEVESRGSIPKKIECLSSGKETPREKSKVIWELRHEFQITKLIQIAKLPRATYYYHIKQMARPDKYAAIKAQILQIYEENKKRVGYRRVTLELHNQNIHINHKTVQRIMRDLGLFCRVRMKRYSSYKGDTGVVADNLLNRAFEATQPNEKWVTDVTEFSMFGQKLYLSPILDLYSRDIVSYSISDRPRFSAVVDMLEQAFATLPNDTNLILHSDQGWQYQMKAYQLMLKAKGVRQSMSRKGNCLDNAVIENFFGILKSELLYLQDFSSMEHFKLELTEYLHYYNHRRIKQKLKGLSPAFHRQQALSIA